jgi:hypothetical protein
MQAAELKLRRRMLDLEIIQGGKRDAQQHEPAVAPGNF